MRIFADAVGFEWDDGNRDKNLIKHGVTNGECEEAFSDSKRVVREDRKRSRAESRHHLVGRTSRGRILFVSFTVRKTLIRVISARDINKKERTLYEK